MHCPACQHENNPGAKFCEECGAVLAGSTPSVPPPPIANTLTPDPLPASFASGRYQVQRLLGEGARKRVYLAHDMRLDRDVALAVIKTDGLDDAGRLRVHREAQAMADLGDHPHIVTVHDSGEENGTLYIVSQFMAGGSVEDLQRVAAEQQTRHLPIAEALRIADQICQALEHAHRRGVVHRDVKSANVWLTADGTAKLGDFGLALSLAESRLTQPGMMVGTVTYMAPEQALGGAVTAQADLYALGVVLYEMVAGRPPFLGDDPVAVIGQHLQAAAVAPSHHNSAVPAELDELILRLLAKAPEERPASAGAVRSALAACVRVAAAPADAAAPGTSPTALDALAGGVFVGRERETQTLRATLAEALAGRGRLLTLVGEPGIGKTRMTEELATYARLRGAEVLVGRCYEGEGAPAYWPWVQIVRSYVQAREPSAWLAEMGPGAADIADMVPELRRSAASLSVTPPMEPEQARFRLFDSLSAFFKAAAQARPLVLVLDDLHWADKPSLLLLQFLAKDIANLRLLFVGTYRDIELGRHHPLEEALAELARNPRSERALLRGLQEGDVARFIELAAGTRPPAALVQAIFRETEGNPFFMQEVVRLLHTDGRLARADSIASWSIEIPQSVRSVVGQRLRHLSEACNQVLTIAAAVGREFDAKLVDALAAGDEGPSDASLDRLLDRLDEAVQARILVEVADAPGRYRFAHALVRETLYDELRTVQRVRLHRRIGETIERLHSGSIEGHLPELAHHFGEAAASGSLQKAVDYAIRAAQRADQLLAFEAAAAHYQRALQMLELGETPDDRRRCEVLIALGEAQIASGDPAQAAQNCRAALRLARALNDATLLARAALGLTAQTTFVPSEAEERGQILQETVNRLDDGEAVLKLRLLNRMNQTRIWLDSEIERAARAEQMAELARRSGDDMAHALFWELGSASAVADPRTLSEIGKLALDALRAAEAAGREESIFFARHALYRSHVISGEGADAEREQERAAALAQRLRSRALRSTTEAMQCQRALWEGRLGDAERHMQAALDLFPSSRMGGTFQVYSTQIGALRRLQGRLADVERGVRRGAELLPFVVAYRCHLACFLAEMGHQDDARAVFAEVALGGFAKLRRDGNYLMNLALLCDACLLVGNLEAATLLYDLVRPFEGTCLFFATATTYGCADRHLGNLAAMVERFDDATRHFEQALAFERRMGARTWLARAQIDYARMCLTRGAAGDTEHALQLLSESLATSQALGLAGWVHLALPLKLRAQGMEATDLGRSIDIVAASVESRRPDMHAHTSVEGQVTLMFSDMEGFTNMTERLGDREAFKVIQAHNAIVREQLHAHGGHELELQGDGFLLAFPSAIQGVRCAIAIQRAFASYSAAHVEQPIRVRIGLHTGEALRDRDKFFGRTVILAARIAAQALGGEILISAILRAAVEPSGTIRFGESRDVVLKGLAGTYPLHAVAWEA
jgi:class 3 adenylate cyclase